MKKKSKLTIQFIYGKDLEKIGKSVDGFPLYVRVIYRRIVTVFISRVGLWYSLENTGNVDSIRLFKDKRDELVLKETKFINQLRDYFEDYLNISFDPRVLVRSGIDNLCFNNVLSYLDKMIITHYVEGVLLKKSSDSIKLLEKAGPLLVMSFLRNVNVELLEEILRIRNNRETFEYYKIIKYLGLEDLNILEFRLLETKSGKEFKKLKEWFDPTFDEEVLKLVSDYSK
ncbi:hypothetical protein MM239_11075 [Belliella sp. DSM 111904]|uniref:Uncharacterized protein n=1 Tax=Belliella filtrata TaxID=2923435 RepID=A0ABS9V0L1_9BACT|nr:hypothetical protein [Belliella filtrata]MCH7409937.1 hypothetical protein [Belliella filtrata]